MLSCFVQEAAVKLGIIGLLCKVKKQDGTHIHQMKLSKLVDVGLSGGQRDNVEAIVDLIAKKIVEAPAMDLGPLLVVPVDRGLRPIEALAAMDNKTPTFSVLGGGHQARARRKVSQQEKHKEMLRKNPGVTTPFCWVYAMGILQLIDEFEVILTYYTFFICTLIIYLKAAEIKKKQDAGVPFIVEDNSSRVILMSDAATESIGPRVPEWSQISLEDRAQTPTVCDAISILMVNHDRQQGFKSEWTLTQQLTRIRQDLHDYGHGKFNVKKFRNFWTVSKNSGIFCHQY